MKLYGNLTNRFEENRHTVDTIEIGTKITEYHFTDRDVYEVVEVKDQKHIVVKEMKATAIGAPMTNNWKLESDPEAAEQALTKRGNYWYWTAEITLKDYEELKDNVDFKIYMCVNGFDAEVIKEKGKQTKYKRTNISIGRADYYFDYEF